MSGRRKGLVSWIMNNEWESEQSKFQIRHTEHEAVLKFHQVQDTYPAMLKNSTKQVNSADASASSASGPASPSAVETTPKPRKKLSFKEPEILNYLKLRKPFGKPKPPPLQLTRSTGSVDFNFDENPFEEENDDLEELEVKVTTMFRGIIPFMGWVYGVARTTIKTKVE